MNPEIQKLNQELKETQNEAAQNWRCASMHDPSERRGIWFKMLPNKKLVMCGGREGDDSIVIIPPELSEKVYDVLAYGAWMQEEYGPDSKYLPAKYYEKFIGATAMDENPPDQSTQQPSNKVK